MPMACQDLLAPGFLQNRPSSTDALGKKRLRKGSTQHMEKSLLVCVAGEARVLETTTSSAACWVAPKRAQGLISTSVSVCWGRAQVYPEVAFVDPSTGRPVFVLF